MSNILDTRDLDERLQELEQLEIDEQEAVDEARDEWEADEDNDPADFDGEDHKILCYDDKEELEELRGLRDEISDWEDGNTLIAESYWVDYVEEMLKDCGDLPQCIPPYIVIDWEETAENIAVDYNVVDYQGETYYVRSY